MLLEIVTSFLIGESRKYPTLNSHGTVQAPGAIFFNHAHLNAFNINWT